MGGSVEKQKSRKQPFDCSQLFRERHFLSVIRFSFVAYFGRPTFMFYYPAGKFNFGHLLV